MSKAKMPDPVKYLYRVRYLGGDIVSVDSPNADEEIIDAVPLITTTQAEAYAQAVRDEAEKLSRAKHYGNGHQDGWNSALEIVAKKASGKYLMPEFAKAIRALKGKP